MQALRYAAWRVEEMTCVRPEYSLTAPFDGLMVLVFCTTGAVGERCQQ